MKPLEINPHIKMQYLAFRLIDFVFKFIGKYFWYWYWYEYRKKYFEVLVSLRPKN